MKKFLQRIGRVFLVIAVVSCGGDGNRSSREQFSEDEIYLIDAYVKTKHASSYYPHRPVVAESLFARLDSTIDSVRIANTIKTVSQTPERWVAIFTEIEDNLREAARKKNSEEAGGGSRAPVEVEKNDEHH